MIWLFGLLLVLHYSSDVQLDKLKWCDQYKNDLQLY